MQTLYNQAFESKLREADATELKDVALTCLEALYKIKLTIIEGLKQCQDGDWLVPVQMIDQCINEAHMQVDEALGITAHRPNPDVTDLQQDDHSTDVTGYINCAGFPCKLS